MKLLLIPLLSLSLIGCAGTVKLRTEVQEQYVPLLYCPAPPEINKPTLPLYEITSNMPAGEVVQRYRASIITLQGYAGELERVLEEYDKTDAAYEELRNRFKTQWKEEFNQAIEDSE